MPDFSYALVFAYHIIQATGTTLGGVIPYGADPTTTPPDPNLPAPFNGWIISENSIYDPSDPLAGVPLPAGDQNFLHQYAGGRSGAVASNIQFSTLNRGRARNSAYGVSGSISVLDSAGNSHAVDIDMALITGAGYADSRHPEVRGSTRLAWYHDIHGLLRYTLVDATRTLADLQRTSPGLEGFVNATDAAAYAVRSWVANQAKRGQFDFDLGWDRMVQEGRNMVEDQQLTDSQAVQTYLAAQVQSLQAIRRILVVGA